MGKKSKPAAPPALGGSNSFRGMLGAQPAPASAPQPMEAGMLGSAGGGGMFGGGMPSRKHAMIGALMGTPGASSDNPWTAMTQGMAPGAGAYGQANAVQPAAAPPPDYASMAAAQSPQANAWGQTAPQAMPSRDYNPMQQAVPQAEAQPDSLASRYAQQTGQPAPQPAAQAAPQPPMDAQQIAALRAQFAR